MQCDLHEWMCRNVWFISFVKVYFARLNTLLQRAACCGSVEIPCRFIHTLCVQKGADIIMILSLSGEIAFTRHSNAAALIL